jgi:hypothetical protein
MLDVRTPLTTTWLEEYMSLYMLPAPVCIPDATSQHGSMRAMLTLSHGLVLE